MWPLLLQGTCYSLVYYCVSLWKNNTLVPPYKRQYLVPVAFFCVQIEHARRLYHRKPACDLVSGVKSVIAIANLE